MNCFWNGFEKRAFEQTQTDEIKPPKGFDIRGPIIGSAAMGGLVEGAFGVIDGSRKGLTGALSGGLKGLGKGLALGSGIGLGMGLGMKALAGMRDKKKSEKIARELTTKARKSLPDGAFAFPKERRYPIHDRIHARNALARVSQFGSPSEISAVRSAVKSKFPDIGED